MIGEFYTYRHIRPDTNEVFYIGKGRRRRAWDMYNRTKFWNNIVNANNGHYIVEIVTENLLEIDAILHEIYLIKLYGRRDLGLGTLCNLTDGGEGASGSKGNLGKKRGSQSLKHKEAIRKANTGRIFGPCPEERKLKMSIAHKGKKLSKKHCINIGLGHSKQVLNKNTGEIYTSIKEASEKLKRTTSYIWNMLNNKRPNKFNLEYYKDCK